MCLCLFGKHPFAGEPCGKGDHTPELYKACAKAPPGSSTVQYISPDDSLPPTDSKHHISICLIHYQCSMLAMLHACAAPHVLTESHSPLMALLQW